MPIRLLRFAQSLRALRWLVGFTLGMADPVLHSISDYSSTYFVDLAYLGGEVENCDASVNIQALSEIEKRLPLALVRRDCIICGAFGPISDLLSWSKA